MNRKTRPKVIIVSILIVAILAISMLAYTKNLSFIQEEALTSIAGLGCSSSNFNTCMGLQGIRYQCNGASWIRAECPTGMTFAGGACGNCVVKTGVSTCSRTSPSCPTGNTCDFASGVCVTKPSECNGVVTSDCVCGTIGLLHSGYCKNGVFSSTSPPINTCSPFASYKCDGNSYYRCDSTWTKVKDCPLNTVCKVLSNGATCEKTRTPYVISLDECRLGSVKCDGDKIFECLVTESGFGPYKWIQQEDCTALASGGYCKTIDSNTVQCFQKTQTSPTSSLRCNNGHREYYQSGTWMASQNGVTFDCPSGYHCDASATDTSLCAKDWSSVSCSSNYATQCMILGKVCDMSKSICVSKPEDCVAEKKYAYSTDNDGCMCGELLIYNGYCENEKPVPEKTECAWYQEISTQTECGIGCSIAKYATFGFLDTSTTTTVCKTAAWFWVASVISMLALIILIIYVAKKPKARRR